MNTQKKLKELLKYAPKGNEYTDAINEAIKTLKAVESAKEVLPEKIPILASMLTQEVYEAKGHNNCLKLAITILAKVIEERDRLKERIKCWTNKCNDLNTEIGALLLERDKAQKEVEELKAYAKLGNIPYKDIAEIIDTVMNKEHINFITHKKLNHEDILNIISNAIVGFINKPTIQEYKCNNQSGGTKVKYE